MLHIRTDVFHADTETEIIFLDASTNRTEGGHILYTRIQRDARCLSIWNAFRNHSGHNTSRNITTETLRISQTDVGHIHPKCTNATVRILLSCDIDWLDAILHHSHTKGSAFTHLLCQCSTVNGNTRTHQPLSS